MERRDTEQERERAHLRKESEQNDKGSTVVATEERNRHVPMKG